MGAHADGAPTRGLALSPTSAVRGIFPTSKSKSLKKKSSILAKRRHMPAAALAARGAAGGVWQRVRGPARPRWARRHLLLAHNLLYAYRAPDCVKAACMIYLEGFTAAPAPEVKSRAHAFKVYHTGTAFYFACDSRDAQLAWIQLIQRATLLPSLAARMDVSKQFSETDYSESESDSERPARSRSPDKDGATFGSLRKLTQRSHEPPHAATSLDRKYLRFFTRNKSKDDAKLKKAQAGVPVPTEHYRSYRRPPPAGSPPAPAPAPPRSPPRVTVEGAEEGARSRRLPKPINYIHASNPNLLDFDKSDFVTKPTLHVPKPKPKTENLVGFVTLEQFMLKKQAEERRQLYTNRVLMGVEHQHRAQLRDLRHRLDDIVPDVIYGEVCAGESASASAGKPVSVRGKDGYEKIVYRDEMEGARSRGPAPRAPAPPALPGPRRRSPPPAPERWRDSLRRNDKVHTTSAEVTAPLKAATQYTPLSHQHLHLAVDSRSGSSGVTSSAGGTAGGAPPGSRRGAHYPHLVCPPTFQPETYSLARLPPRTREHDG